MKHFKMCSLLPQLFPFYTTKIPPKVDWFCSVFSEQIGSSVVLRQKSIPWIQLKFCRWLFSEHLLLLVLRCMLPLHFFSSHPFCLIYWHKIFGPVVLKLESMRFYLLCLRWGLSFHISNDSHIMLKTLIPRTHLTGNRWSCSRKHLRCQCAPLQRPRWPLLPVRLFPEWDHPSNRVTWGPHLKCRGLCSFHKSEFLSSKSKLYALF